MQRINHEFFRQHAGYSYDSKTQTPEQGRDECARRLANAYSAAQEAGCSWEWDIDPDITSSDWCDDDPPWQTWCCIMRDGGGAVVGSLGGVDFGRDADPWGDPYRIVVEAQLATEYDPD